MEHELKWTNDLIKRDPVIEIMIYLESRLFVGLFIKI